MGGGSALLALQAASAPACQLSLLGPVTQAPLTYNPFQAGASAAEVSFTVRNRDSKPCEAAFAFFRLGAPQARAEDGAALNYQLLGGLAPRHKGRQIRRTRFRAAALRQAYGGGEADLYGACGDFGRRWTGGRTRHVHRPADPWHVSARGGGRLYEGRRCATYRDDQCEFANDSRGGWRRPQDDTELRRLRRRSHALGAPTGLFKSALSSGREL